MEGSPRLLKHANLRQLVNELDAIYEAVDDNRLADHFAGVLQRLIPGDFYGVSVVIRNGQRNHRAARLFPTPKGWPELAYVFANLYSTFPLRSIRESGDLHRPIALSDVANRAKIERLDLYHDYYRSLSVVDDLDTSKEGVYEVGCREPMVCGPSRTANPGFGPFDVSRLSRGLGRKAAGKPEQKQPKSAANETECRDIVRWRKPIERE
jgi:hypothetical protein